MIELKRIYFLLLIVVLSACAGQKVSPEAVTPPHTSPASTALEGPEEGFITALNAFTTRDMESVLVITQEVVEQYPNTPWAKRSLFLRGRALIALDRAPDANEVMLLVSRTYPELADYALYYLADYHFSEKRFTEATEGFRRLQKDHPGSFWEEPSAQKMAQALFESGWYYQAAEAFHAYLKEYPRSEFRTEAALNEARSYAAAGDVERAVRAYHSVYTEHPGEPADQEVKRGLDELRHHGATFPDLTADEMYKRARKLLRAKEYEKAYESFTRVLQLSPDYPQKVDVLYRTGLSLYYQRRRSEAIAVLERIVREHPTARRSPDALKWLGRTYGRLGKVEKAVNSYLKIVSSYPKSRRADDALYVIGNIYRDTNTKKALTYFDQLAKRYPRSKFADSAVWWIAWIHYEDRNYPQAEQTLERLIRKYARSFLVHQARYWLGRIAEQKGDQKGAATYYQQVIARAPYTYYGYRATERLTLLNFPVLALPVEPDVFDYVNDRENEDADWDELDTPDPDEARETNGPPVWTEEAVQALSSNPTFRKTLELMILDMKKEAAAELWALQRAIPKKHASLLGVSKAFFELEDYYRSLLLVLRNYDRYLKRPLKGTPDDLWLLAYPQGYWGSIVSHAERYNLDPYLIAAIIREESRFQPEALSPAGARGIMQVMPSTGRWVAQMIRLRGFDREQLYNHNTNIKIGTWYIRHLMKQFNGDPFLAAAAYNAGPGAVKSWIKKKGAVRDRDEFVEAIPYVETRWYVKRVMRSYSEYKRIYSVSEQFAGHPYLPARWTLSSVNRKGKAPSP